MPKLAKNPGTVGPWSLVRRARYNLTRLRRQLRRFIIGREFENIGEQADADETITEIVTQLAEILGAHWEQAGEPWPAMITRQWKRDGTKNVMPLSAAVANLTRNGMDQPLGGKNKRAAEWLRRLGDGETCETRFATFKVVAMTQEGVGLGTAPKQMAIAG